MGRGMSAEVRRATRGEALDGWMRCTDGSRRVPRFEKKETNTRCTERRVDPDARSLARSQTDFARTDFDDER